MFQDRNDIFDFLVPLKAADILNEQFGYKVRNLNKYLIGSFSVGLLK